MKNFWSKFALGIVSLLAVLGFTLSAQAATLGGSPSVNLDSYQAGRQTSYHINFTATSGIPAQGVIDITFVSTGADRADITSASLNLTGSSTNLGAATLTILPAPSDNIIRITLGADGVAAVGEEVRIQFDNIINATAAQNYHVSLSTYDNSDPRNLIDGPTDSSAFSIVAAAARNISFCPASPQEVSADNNQLEITATLTDQYGNPVADGTLVNWQSSNSLFTFDPDNQTITGNGGQTTVTMNTPTVAGETSNITAASGVISDPYTVTVVVGDFHHISISTTEPTTITAGSTIQFVAKAYDEWNNVLSGAYTFTWNGTTNSNGLFSNTAAGTYSVQAHYVSGTAYDSNIISVTVNHSLADHLTIDPTDLHLSNADQTQAYLVTAFDGFNNSWNASNDSAMQFSTTDPVGTFTGNLYAAGKVGTWVITANYQGKTISTNITIDNPGVAGTIQLQNSTSEIEVNEIHQFTVKVYDNDGNEIIDPTLQWSVSVGQDNSVIDTLGRFVAIKVGNYSILVKSAGIELIIPVIVADAKTVTTTAATTTSSSDTTGQSSSTGTSLQSPTVISDQLPNPDDQGEIKGTEVTTVGADANQEEENNSKGWVTVLTIIIVAGLLAAGYYGYTVWGSEKTDKIVKKSAASQKNTQGPTPKTEPENKVDKTDDQGKLRW